MLNSLTKTKTDTFWISENFPEVDIKIAFQITPKDKDILGQMVFISYPKVRVAQEYIDPIWSRNGIEGVHEALVENKFDLDSFEPEIICLEVSSTYPWQEFNDSELYRIGRKVRDLAREVVGKIITEFQKDGIG